LEALTGLLLQNQYSFDAVKLVVVAVIIAVPPFWTDKPKGWTAIAGGPPSWAWHLTVKEAKKTKHIAAFIKQRMWNLYLLSIIQDT
jgi:hypothetical protein